MTVKMCVYGEEKQTIAILRRETRKQGKRGLLVWKRRENRWEGIRKVRRIEMRSKKKRRSRRIAGRDVVEAGSLTLVTRAAAFWER
jgi:hypothetical protein